MYHNVHAPVATLEKAPVKTGGLCAIKFFKWEDVLTWPSINPQTGMLSSAITLKPGKFIYLAKAIDQLRSFEEQQKESTAGIYYDLTIKASLPGSNAANILSLQTMVHHQWGLIVEDRNGVNRLIGNQDSGATLSKNYDSGTLTISRKTEITLTWQHPQPAPIYAASAFDVVIGGQTITAGALQLIMRFQVGDPGAPMEEGDTVLTNAAFVNKYCLVIAGGLALPVDDGSGSINWVGSIIRHIEKTLAGNTITFVGGVVNTEIIEIYAFNS
jgi:hypothetical protein